MRVESRIVSIVPEVVVLAQAVDLDAAVPGVSGDLLSFTTADLENAGRYGQQSVQIAGSRAVNGASGSLTINGDHILTNWEVVAFCMT